MRFGPEEAGGKIDRRKRYTQMVLKDSFIYLLKQKQISKITVKEVCELADINRSTFYAHYTDLYDLLEQIEEDIIREMIHFLSIYQNEPAGNSIQITERLIEYLAENKEECEALLSENSHSSFEKKVRKVAHQFLMTHWLKVPISDDNIVDYISAFIISGSIQIVKVWLQNGMDKSPQEIAHLITKLVNEGI